jgi:hypothetical protein
VTGEPNPPTILLSGSSIDVTDRSGRPVPLEKFWPNCPACGGILQGDYGVGPEGKLYHFNHLPGAGDEPDPEPKEEC